ncbi:nucleoside diphosphate kinase [Catenaria anguillulae PL171]|uniref:Nucleoside diphosphate kinase n=1 Tax=Catenaria anguillulae PL171 TaxID=765915 RepID=A0A1Y2HNE5_9FUNG|nr:nucleoside diphosphate kinase [Catenaria anguillulae PL171]
MARPNTGGAARKEIEVISKIDNDDDLIHFLNGHDSVTVVDMYPKYCGPCEPMAGVFKRLKVDYQDQVAFAQAQTDAISFFESIRHKSCPLFSVWVNGVYVNCVRGANSPLLEHIIKEQVELNKITKERKPGIPEVDIPQIIRPGIQFTPGSHALRMSTNLTDAVDESTRFTISFIKPDAMLPHIIAEVASAAKLNRFDIVKERRMWLSEATAKQLYAEHAERPFFGELIDYVTSGPILALLLSHTGTDSEASDHAAAINAWRQVVGPSSPKHALEVAPRSLRAQFGKDGLHNGFYASDSPAAAQREMELLFSPAIPSLPNVLMNTDMTMTLTALSPEISSDAAKVEAVVQRALHCNMEVHKRGSVTLSKEQVIEWLGDEAAGSDEVVAKWTAGPVMALVLKGEDVIHLWSELVYGNVDQVVEADANPRTIRASLGGGDCIRCSKSADQAHREMNVFFPRPMSTFVKPVTLERTIALIKPDATAAGKATEIMQKIEERGFRIVDKKQFTMTMETAKEFYRDHVGKPFYDELTQWMTSEPIWALVLEKDSAIVSWREAMGPTNSIKAKEIAPDTLRALYGTDGSKNALHGSDSPANAAREITLIFGEHRALPSNMPSRVASLVNLAPAEPAPASNPDTSPPADIAVPVPTGDSGEAAAASPAPPTERPKSGAAKGASRPASSKSRPVSATAAKAAAAGSKPASRPASSSAAKSKDALAPQDGPQPPKTSRPSSQTSLRKSKAQLAGDGSGPSPS